MENLNINSVNNDLDNNEKNKKSLNDNEYKEEDIKSQIALTENSFDKSENTLDLTIKENSKLKIINED